jgi:outer membrane protein assembly factor BamB
MILPCAAQCRAWRVGLAALWSCGLLAAADWPQFRGPNRDGVSAEADLLQRWPEGGPRLAWQADGIGHGYSSPVVQGDQVIVTGDIGEDLVIRALDRRSGTPRWQAAHGRAWKGQFPGARSTCALTEGRLYLLNTHGLVLCADSATGTALWTADILERFKGPNIQWGLSECLLVDQGRVIVTPGGDDAFLAALDAGTGQTAWASPPLRFTRTVAFGGKAVEPPVPDVDRAGYASPVPFEVDGRRLLAAVGGRHLVVADAGNGELLWTREVAAIYEVIGAIPVWCEAGLLFAAPDVGALMFGVSVEAGKVAVTERWHHPIDNCHGAFVQRDGAIFGAGYRLYRPWAAIEAATGAVRGELKDLAKGCILYADGRLYAFTETGDLALLRFGPEGLAVEGRFALPGATGSDNWSHPAIADGHLFVRCHDRLFCYDIRAPAP